MNDHRDEEDEQECVFVPEEGGKFDTGTPLYLVAFLIPYVCVPYRYMHIYGPHVIHASDLELFY